MSSCSESDHEGFTCYWLIENFGWCRLTKNLDLVSDTFETMWNNFKFHLEISHNEEDFFDVFLFKENGGPNIYLHYSVSVSSQHGKIIKSSFFKRKFISGGNGCGDNELIKWDELFKNLHSSDSDIRNASITVTFHMWKENTKKSSNCLLISLMENDNDVLHLSKLYFSDYKQNVGREFMKFLDQKTLITTAKNTDKFPIKEAGVQTDTKIFKNEFKDEDELLRFFAQEKFCYVTLRTSNKDFAVHKALICARSPVFNAMFYNDMIENERNIVDIDDIDHEILSLLLQFLHLQPMKELKWETAVKLYYAADKYQIEKLKNECRMHLKNQLTIENVCELFILSDMHEDEYLKYCAQECFCDHYQLILQSKEWDDLLFNQTKLAREILHMYAQKPNISKSLSQVLEEISEM